LRSLIRRIYGEPPPKEAPRSAMLRWVRQFYWKPLPLIVVFYALVLSVATAWLLVVLGVSAVTWAWGIISISLRIRREERRGN